MSLTASGRIQLVRQILDEFETNPEYKIPNAVDLVLLANSLPPVEMDPGWEGFRRAAQGSLLAASDDTLREAARHVLDSRNISGSTGSATWSPGLVRVFLSHVAEHKEHAALAKEDLHNYGISAFVAHESIEETRAWEEEIESALWSAEALVALLHPTFSDSPWTNQEVGWAKGRRIPVFAIRLGGEPRGFLSKQQWGEGYGDKPEATAKRIAEWVNMQPQFSERIAGGLLVALRAAGNYVDSSRICAGLNTFSKLTEAQFADLDEIFLANNQVHGCLLARRELAPLYKRNEREFPKIRQGK